MNLRRFVLAVCLWGVTAGPVSAALTLGAPFSQKMVLQRDKPLPVWGWAETGRVITVTIAGVSRSSQANTQGWWRVELPAMSAGGPYELVVSGDGEIRLQDVLVGEVWICSGQSNMAMTLAETANAEAEIAAANYPSMRFQTLPVSGSGLPRDRLSQTVDWVVCSPSTAGSKSAVAYFFGRELYLNIGVPIGLIVVSTGATPIENWVPREGLDLVPELSATAQAAHTADTNYIAQMAAYEAAVARGESPAMPVHPYMVPGNPNRDLGTLYNGSVAPVEGVALRGMIWYQGESNRGDYSDYYFNFHKALVHGWRATWELGAFPFYYVQISALDSWRENWQVPEIWEGQSWVMSLTNTGMAVIHDLATDITLIHPKEKVEVGRRLAFWALAKNYGFTSLSYAGPMVKSSQISGSNIVIQFDYAFGGLKSRTGAPLDWFTIAGANQVYVSAQTRIEGDRIVVWSSQVAQPKAVRFAWDETAQPNLVNGAGLPASPFRIAVLTDQSTDYFVATNGNDTLGDGSSSAPWATVDKAITIVNGAVGYHTIYVGAGTFYCDGKNIGITKPVRIVGAGPNLTILERNTSIPADYTLYFANANPSNGAPLVFKDLKFANTTQSGLNGILSSNGGQPNFVQFDNVSFDDYNYTKYGIRLNSHEDNNGLDVPEESDWTFKNFSAIRATVNGGSLFLRDQSGGRARHWRWTWDGATIVSNPALYDFSARWVGAAFTLKNSTWSANGHGFYLNDTSDRDILGTNVIDGSIIEDNSTYGVNAQRLGSNAGLIVRNSTIRDTSAGNAQTYGVYVTIPAGNVIGQIRATNTQFSGVGTYGMVITDYGATQTSPIELKNVNFNNCAYGLFINGTAATLWYIDPAQSGATIGGGTLVSGGRKTYYGDANLDGRVDVRDTDFVGAYPKVSGATWATGDFDFDGDFDAADMAWLTPHPHGTVIVIR